MSKIAFMGDASDFDNDAADPIAVEACASRLTLQVLAALPPESHGHLIVDVAAELERRKNPRRSGTGTPTPTPMPGVGTPPPRREASWSAAENPTLDEGGSPADPSEQPPESEAPSKGRSLVRTLVAGRSALKPPSS
jgi:hypothetical protein